MPLLYSGSSVLFYPRMDSFFLPVFAAWFVTLFLQLISWPYVAVFTKKALVDRGWGLGRITGWLVIGLLIWYPAHLLPVNTTFGIWFVLVLLLIGSIYLIYRNFEPLIEALRQAWPFILTEELLFLLGFVFLSYIRAHNPQILDLEKFMDAGFMASYLRSPTLPAPDMWLSGKTINYYTFGHFLGAVMTRLWLMPIKFSYNLLLALVMGLSFSLSFSVVINLIAPSLTKTSRRHLPLIAGGLIGAFFVTVGGNTHTLWYFLKNGNWQGYWYADATRFIHNTIHEFPSYSFVVSDLHAHVWSLPLVLAFIIWLLLWTKKLFSTHASRFGPWALSLVIGLFLGTFIMTSTWDFLIYGLLVAILGITVLVYRPRLLLPLSISALIVMGVTGLIAAPWYLNFTSISGGPAITTEHTPLWQIGVLWTGHLIISGLALGLAIYLLSRVSRLKSSLRPPTYHYLVVMAVITAAWLLLLLPELIYFKDIYSGHPRANTMFKFTYQSFIMMSLMGGWVAGIALIKGLLKVWLRTIVLVCVGAVFVLVMLFPYFAYRDYYGALKDYKGLDGWSWLNEQHPDDLKAINWLQENVKGQPTILEAWGESYTTRNRVSAYTGLPTVIGWRVHEWLWRGGFDIAGKRSGEVDEIYNRPLSAESLNYLNEYQVQYIIIGDEEYQAYPDMSFDELITLGPTVFQSGKTYIIKYSPQPVSVTK